MQGSIDFECEGNSNSPSESVQQLPHESTNCADNVLNDLLSYKGEGQERVWIKWNRLNDGNSVFGEKRKPPSQTHSRCLVANHSKPPLQEVQDDTAIIPWLFSECVVPRTFDDVKLAVGDHFIHQRHALGRAGGIFAAGDHQSRDL